MNFVRQTSRLLQHAQFHQARLVKPTIARLSNYTCHDLSECRSLVMVSGPDSAKYLQNMLTNDINRLSDTSIRSIYAMILNNRGRALHDVLVYRINASDKPADQYLVEVDKNHLQAFLRMCQIYKIKKKVEISPVDSSFKVFSATNDVAKNCDVSLICSSGGFKLYKKK